ncbi:DUF3048 domain-containing protein [Streptomyces cyaneochromogenes]|uniref:DUF3048 domain-containing protein n=1 Tax=Streptomyces cyaneochromogenes TaxID=2496836 RepID=A0A3Q9EYD0_9ACTN|nr:DUF3048 domain-containing protein [Streptomyces cyaneochromogenes]AZQ38903.1 DUF3048 domain-containing protein [Streptomyces cyaneochromogenes]
MVRQRATRTRRATTTALLAAALAASLTAGCTTSGGPLDDGRGRERSPAPSESGNRQAHGSVLAVKIDNVRAARPHMGLNEADIVYVEQVEAGLSRLMAVYAQKLPKTIGPVRSARESDLELLGQFDRPTLAFSGAQSKLMPLIDKAPLEAEPPGKASDAYFRSPYRRSPHNLYLRPGRLMPSAPGAKALTTGFRFGAAPAGGKAETSRTVRYPATRHTFTWSASQNRWLVAMDGTTATTTDGKQVTASTVVVQYVKVRRSAFHDFLGNYTPYTETVGSGKASVLRNGRAYDDVRWERPKATDGTTFTTRDGKPMSFQRGQVWVVLAKAP